MARRTAGTPRWLPACALVVLLAVAWRRLRDHQRVDEAAATTDTLPSWPPFEPAASTSVIAYREAVDGACPPGFPIKANPQSGIYHVPGGRSYQRTRAERCYADPHDAEADGYRRAKS